MFSITQFLDWPGRRIVHILSSFAWWGMVFFLVFILLPVLNRMSSITQQEIIGFVVPRIFRAASIAGFFSVGMGWRNAMEIINGDLNYFFSNGVNFFLLIGGLLATGLYIFHLFLEHQEIEIAMRAKESASMKLDDPEIKKLLNKIQIIPLIGFLIMTTSALTMLIH
ncbi:MAG: hypothetical protein ACW98F_14890 [Candidatus Hodarchaeales archaeon]